MDSIFRLSVNELIATQRGVAGIDFYSSQPQMPTSSAQTMDSNLSKWYEPGDDW